MAPNINAGETSGTITIAGIIDDLISEVMKR